MTHAELVAAAEARNMPLKTLAQTKASIKRAEKVGSAVIFAQSLSSWGRLEADAKAYLNTYIQKCMREAMR